MKNISNQDKKVSKKKVLSAVTITTMLILTAFFVVYPVSAVTFVTVTYPNGGEYVSGTVTITWDSDGGIEDLLRIRFSDDGGDTWTTIISGVSGEERSRPWVTTELDDGSQYVIRVVYYENQTISDDSDDVFTVDNTKPTSSVNSISPYWHSTDLTITATGSDALSGLKNVTLYYAYSADNLTFGSYSAFAVNTTPWLDSNAISWDFNFPDRSGYYRFYSRARDNASNFEDAPGEHDAMCGFHDPDDKVTVTITEPQNNKWYNALTNITGTVTDVLSGVSHVNITIYNATLGKYWNGADWDDTSTDLTATGTTSWYKDDELPTWTNGTTYLINATAIDNLDNPSDTVTHTFFMDTQKPESEVDAIVGYWKNESHNPLTITVTATPDPGSGLDEVTLYFYNSTDNSTWSGPFAYAVNTTPWIGVEFDFTFPNGTGYYRFYSIATDNATNIQDTPIENHTMCGYDTNDIAVAITNPDDGGWNSTVLPLVNITGTCSDSLSGIGSVWIVIYNVSSGLNWTGAEWGILTPLEATLNQDHTIWWYDSTAVTWENATYYAITAVAYDNAGNDEEDTVTFGYDTYEPTTTITEPQYDWYNQLDEISGTASDTFSGVQTVNITIYNETSGKYWDGLDWEDGVEWFNTDLVYGSPVTWSFDANDVTWTNGTYYQINATATDNASNVDSVGASHRFLFDDDPPVSSVEAIDPYWKTDETPLAISFDASDSGSGLHNVTLYYNYSVDNTTWTVQGLKWVHASNPITDPWSTTSWDFDFPDGSGFYGFYTLAVDNATNTETAPAGHVAQAIAGYDIDPPTATITLPLDGGYYNFGSAIDTNITGTASDAQEIALVYVTVYNNTGNTYFDSTTWVAGLPVNLTANMSGAGANWDWWYDNQSAFPDWDSGNVYVITINVQDGAGGWNNSAATASFTYDTDEPDTTITVPTDEGYYNAMTQISGTATDTGGSGIYGVNITIYNETGKYWDGADWEDGVQWLTTNIVYGTPVTWTYNSSSVTWANNTNYTINATAIDNATNVDSSPASHTFYYDTDVPTSEVDAISPYWQIASPLTIEVTAPADPGSGLKNVTLYFYNSTDNSTWSGPFAYAVNTTPWIGVEFDFTFPNGTGYYRFYSIATDNATNIQDTPIENHTMCGYDIENPTVDILMPQHNEYYIEMDEISGTCADSLSGVKEVNITIYNASSGEYWTGAIWDSGVSWLETDLSDGNSNWSYNSTDVTWADGAYIINATATDNATRTSTPASHMFFIDTTPPEVLVEMTGPTYVKQGVEVTIFANFTETGSGINESSVNITIRNATGTLLSYGAIKTSNLLWYYEWTVPAGNDGNVNVSVTATDNVLLPLTGVTWNTSKYIDNTAPTVTIEYNNSATYFKDGDALRIYANFTEDLSGIDEPTVIINITTSGDGGQTNTSMTKTDNTRWHYDWVIPDGSDDDGAFTVLIFAQDNATNLLTPYPTQDTSKFIDNTEPTGIITVPEHEGFYDETLDNITGTADDALSGVAVVTITIYNSTDGAYWTGTTWQVEPYNLSVNGTTDWYFSDPSVFPEFVNGNAYLVNLTVNDTAGNSNTAAASHSFTFDDAPPSVSNVIITDVTIGSTLYVKDGDDISVSATITDAQLGAGDTTYLRANLSGFGGGTAVEATAYTGTVAWWNLSSVTCTPADGTITVTINATDPAGNYNNTEYGTITADNTPPTFSYAVLSPDYDGTNQTYVDVYFSETTMDLDTIAYTDFNISISGVTVVGIENKSGNRVTLRFSTTFQTGDSPTIGIPGEVADLAGNTLTDETVVINTYRIELQSGFNLISFPANTSTVAISTVVSDVSGALTIWRYNPEDNTWNSWVKGVSGDTFRLEPGRGYWFDAGTANTIVGNYNLWPYPGFAPPSYTVVGQAWNLIGHYQAYNQSASTSYGGALASLSDDDVGSVWRYNPVGGGYTNIMIGAQNMQPGQGFWLFKTSSGNKLYTPS